VTPLLNSLSTFGAVAVALVVFGGGGLADLATGIGGAVGILVALALVSIVGLAVLGLFYLQWTRTEYYFDADGDFRVDSGVVSRQERRVALSRLQSVDIVRPLLGRIVGLARLNIDLAGTAHSRVQVGYLSDAEATRLRAEILARSAGVDPGAGEAPEVVLAEVSAGDLIVSLLLRTQTFALLAFSVVVVLFTVANEGAGGLVLLLFTGGLPLLAVVSEFSRFFGFTVADSPDGLRLRYGLTARQSQTVPPGRVQAVEITEPLLWRRRGWVRVSLNVAGQVSASDEGVVGRVLLPVAPAAEAAEIVQRVLPGLDLAAFDFAPVPARARIRAPLQHRTLGVAADDRVFAARRGFLTRRTAVIPHARTQSVLLTQGPWQRRLDVASFEVHSTPGPVQIVAVHRDAREARAIAEEQLVRAARARGEGSGERWMRPRS
jgi:putative membrane protein